MTRPELKLPKSVQTLIVKVENEPTSSFDEFTTHLTFHSLYQIDGGDQHETYELFLKTARYPERYRMSRVQSEPIAPKSLLGSRPPTEANDKFPGALPHLRSLEWDLTDREDKIMSNTAFAVASKVSWDVLRTDLTKILAPFEAWNSRIGEFTQVVADCRSFKNQIANIFLKFSIHCYQVRCVTNPDRDHQFQANYIVRFHNDYESIQMDGMPRWNGTREGLGAPLCGCEAKFRGIDPIRMFYIDPPVSI